MGARQQPTDNAPTWPGVTVTPAPRTAKHPRLRRLGQILVIVLALIVMLVAFAGWRLNATVTAYPGSHFNSGRNAVWLEHTWAGDPHTGAEFDALAARLAREQITYVYAHVGPMESDGSIPDNRAPYAAALVQALRTRLPQVRVLAWIGQLEVAVNDPNEVTVDLSDSQVRAGIVRTADRFVRAFGFDGVHYDIEPIINNNRHFLDLLTETRAALPQGAMLSVSAQKWAPNATLADWAHKVERAGAWWTSYYFAAVAARVDQLAVMSYNTAMPTTDLYSLFVKQETANILDVVRSARNPPEVLIGVPTYDGKEAWFNASAENMASGLRGVVAGLNSDRDTSAFTGVAIYRLATTSDDEWATYDRLWLGR